MTAFSRWIESAAERAKVKPVDLGAIVSLRPSATEVTHHRSQPVRYLQENNNQHSRGRHVQPDPGQVRHRDLF